MALEPATPHVLEGKKKKYDCLEVRYRNLGLCHGEFFLCIACYVTLPRQYKLLYAGFHENLDDFKKLYFDHPIYSYLFIPVDNAVEAAKIISDLTLVQGPSLVARQSNA
ncbi:hypothetical protein [Flavobacterium selenitireducens]|uniref:hypothetical protein n=1 Tax=Flavobacterium selenitireducens TaxID=2722704 RepID=UPI00168B07E2|nr:hypothetical protein [Flavobacterium selenitireducens]MBD3583072.1 hypothetical protein [Flavobacterium selenitireducens]